MSSEYSLGNQTDSVEIQFHTPNWAVQETYFFLYKGGKMTVKYEKSYGDRVSIADVDIEQSTIDSIFNYVNRLFLKKTTPIYASIKKIPYGHDYEGAREIDVYTYRKGKFVVQSYLLQNVQEFRVVLYSDAFKHFYKLLHAIARENSIKYEKDKYPSRVRARYDVYPKAVAIEPKTIQQESE